MSHFCLPAPGDAPDPGGRPRGHGHHLLPLGFHAWAIYAIVGLVLAYFGFRYNLPLTIRSGLYPIFRRRSTGRSGHAVDVFALVGTIFGIATTSGLWRDAALGGDHPPHRHGHPRELFRFGLIGVVIALAGISAVTGLDKGEAPLRAQPSSRHRCSCCSCWWPAPPSTC